MPHTGVNFEFQNISGEKLFNLESTFYKLSTRDLLSQPCCSPNCQPGGAPHGLNGSLGWRASKEASEQYIAQQDLS